MPESEAFVFLAILLGISAFAIHLVSQVMRRSWGGCEVNPWTSRDRQYTPVSRHQPMEHWGGRSGAPLNRPGPGNHRVVFLAATQE